MYDFIKNRLKELGKTQKELAGVMNIETPHLSAVFKGIRQIKATEIVPMANFLKFDIEKFTKYIAGKISEEELLTSPVTSIFKIGYVQAGMFNEACQLPENEWIDVPYSANNKYINAHLFALGVKGNSMNKIFPPEQTTLICCPIHEWLKINFNTEISGKYIIAYRKNSDGLCEATVKRYERKDTNTVMLFAESTEKEFEFPIVLHPDNNEYDIAAVVISYIRDC